METSDEDEVSAMLEFHTNWGGISRTPLLNFSREIMKKTIYYLFLASPHIGWKVAPNSTICVLLIKVQVNIM